MTFEHGPICTCPACMDKSRHRHVIERAEQKSGKGWRKCTVCKGTGMVDKHKHTLEQEVCRNCKGKGEIIVSVK